MFLVVTDGRGTVLFLLKIIIYFLNPAKNGDAAKEHGKPARPFV